MAPVIAAIPAAFSFLAANASTIGTLATVGGSLLGAGGSIYSGMQAEASAKVQSKAMKEKGDQEYAIAQRRAMETRRQKQLALGRTLAVASASGGGTGDTVSDIMTGIEQRGEYNALTDLYSGSVARNDLYTNAAITKAEGKQAKTAGFINAGTSLLSTAGTIYSDYGKRKRASRSYDYEMGA
jgi:hypothetical protein